MKRRRWFVVLALALGFAAAISRSGQAAGQCKPLYGVMLSHYRVDANAQCVTGRDIANVLAAGAVVPQYDDPAVRKSVQGVLTEVKAAGFGLVRLTIWFTGDRIAAPWGQLATPLSADDQRRIVAYAGDIKAAGFRKLVVVLNPGVHNSPLCKQVTFGDCWDPTREPINLQFIGAVHAALAPLASAGFQLEYDISGELCPSRYLPAQADSNIGSYVTHLITWYSRDVSATDFRISCGGFGDDRLALLLSIFDRAGVRPNVIDMHLYDEDQPMIDRKLVPAAEIARQRRLPFVVGELHYESPAESAGISSVSRRTGVCPSELIEWPLRGKTFCQINVNPPFSPEVLRSEMER